MANDYFNHENPLTRHTLGRAEQVNSTFNAIEAAFDKLPSPDQINRGSVAYVPDIGSVNAFVVNFSRVPESYTEGMNFTMKAASTNSGPSTINVNGLGAKQIRRFDGNPLEPGDIRAGQLVILGYDGSRFLILGAHGAELAKAKQWATSTTVVESGLLGARGYAEKADRWANENEDVVVDDGRYSAKHWALKAMSNAGLLPDANLDIPSRSYRDLGTPSQKFRDGNFSRNVNALAFVGSGASLTNINAGALASGIVPPARLSGNYSFARLTLSERITTPALVMDASSSIGRPYNNSFLRIYGGEIGNTDAATVVLRGATHPEGVSGWLTAEGQIGLLWSASQVEIRVNTEILGNLDVTGVISGDGSGLSALKPDANYSFARLTLSERITTPALVMDASSSIGRPYNNSFLRIYGGEIGNTDAANIILRGATHTAGPSGMLGSKSNTVFLWSDDENVSYRDTRFTRDVTVEGTLSGDGSGLTNVPAGALTGTIAAARLPNHSAGLLTSGTLPNGRLSGDYSFANLTLTGLASVSGGVSTQHLRLGSGTSYAIHRNTDNSWLELAGGDDAGKGGVIRLYGPDSSDDGRLMHGGNTRLSWGSFGVRVDNGVGGLSMVATVYAGSSANNTDFPIGHVIWGIGRDAVDRNASATVRVSSDNSHEYDIAGGTGTALSGTWRSRGRYNGGNVMQRTA